MTLSLVDGLAVDLDGALLRRRVREGRGRGGAAGGLRGRGRQDVVRRRPRGGSGGGRAVEPGLLRVGPGPAVPFGLALRRGLGLWK